MERWEEVCLVGDFAGDFRKSEPPFWGLSIVLVPDLDREEPAGDHEGRGEPTDFVPLGGT
jgi:hypothetical protein